MGKNKSRNTSEIIRNNAKKRFEEAVERKKQAEAKVIVNKNNFDKIRADIDYIAMMCDVELEEVTENE